MLAAAATRFLCAFCILRSKVRVGVGARESPIVVDAGMMADDMVSTHHKGSRIDSPVVGDVGGAV